MRIAILGAGAWGSALAVSFSGAHEVCLWARRPEACVELARARSSHYLPGAPFPESLRIEAGLLEEKAALCSGATAWSTTPIGRLGVPELYVTDGPHGVRRAAEADTLISQSLPATCFPTASCLASSRNVDLLTQLGQALGEECIALKVDVLLGPGTNMKRTPVGGRNFEYFSEDPYLAGEMAASFISGVQSRGVGTSLKHYAVNNQEYERFRINAEVDVRTLREIYLPAFETAVKAQPWTVMCAYNKLNGTYCSSIMNC